jgi:hypothetical protein
MSASRVARRDAVQPGLSAESCGPMVGGSIVAADQGLRRSWWRTSICGTTGPCRKSEADRGAEKPAAS